MQVMDEPQAVRHADVKEHDVRLQLVAPLQRETLGSAASATTLNPSWRPSISDSPSRYRRNANSNEDPDLIGRSR